MQQSLTSVTATFSPNCKMKKAELVFIPAPGLSHLVSILQLAKLLVDRDDRFSITVVIMTLRIDSKIDSYIESFSSASNHIRFIRLPKHEPDPDQPIRFLHEGIDTQKTHVQEAVSKLVTQSESIPESPKFAGFVLDMFCTPMIDVANEFGLPSYFFFPTSAAYLGLELYMRELHDEQNVDPTEFKDSDAELVMPCLVNPLPAKALPSSFLYREWLPVSFGISRRIRETKGVIVNTFEELESHALNSFANGNAPPVYPVGPILNLNHDGQDVGAEQAKISKDIMQWLDDQPPSSVVFLCFGSRRTGSFGVEQVKEIASALEKSGHRFLWVLRHPQPKEKVEAPKDLVNPEKILPEGFLDRTFEIGKIIEWAPQIEILAHPSIGGFVSHCGWNSILESIWFGVPIATWPLYAEQQYNAFQLVVELGISVEIKMDYMIDFISENKCIVTAEVIEKGIRNLMEIDNATKEKLKEISGKSREAWTDGKSSYNWLGHLIEDMINNMS